MLGSVIMASIPMAVLLAAAVYIYYRRSPADPHEQQSQTSFSWSRAPTQSGIRRRHRVQTSTNNATHPSDSPHLGFAEEKHCEICFEIVPCVRLYPCNHTDICADCVNKIVTTPERLCPFCRSRISGYEELTSG